MRKDRVYKVILILNLGTFNVVGDGCECPTGKGPQSSCKHLGSLCYSLEKYSHLEKSPEYPTCTDNIQEWNKPQNRKLDSPTVTSLSFQRKKTLEKENFLSYVVIDPPPQGHP